MENSENHSTEKRILAVTEQWKTPFEDGSEKVAKARLMVMAENSANRVSERKFYTLRAVAASFIGLVLLSSVHYYLGKVEFKGLAQETMVLLPDSSTVKILEGSNLSYNRFSWLLYREVDFSGNGFFSVKKGEKFKVHTALGSVKVLGTTFNVRCDSSNFFVHCTKGAVGIQVGEVDTILKPKEYFFSNNGGLSHFGAYDPNLSEYYREGEKIIYQEVPITLVILDLEQFFKKEIKCTLPTNLRYSGELSSSNPDASFSVFCKTFGAKYEKSTDGTIWIHP